MKEEGVAALNRLSFAVVVVDLLSALMLLLMILITGLLVLVRCGSQIDRVEAAVYV